jgi:hypothetical protein
MTAVEWLVCGDPKRMLEHLGAVLDRRRCILFFCACERRCVPRYEPEILDATERYAEGQATAGEVLTAYLREGNFVDMNFVTDEIGSLSWAVSESLGSTRRNAHAILERASAESRDLTTAEREALRLSEIEVEKRNQCNLIRDIFGNPFHRVCFTPASITSNACRLAESIYEDRAFDRLPILADALEEAGCTDTDILDHCREPGPHVRGCWVVDLLLGKE